jgi:hypothetical protein
MQYFRSLREWHCPLINIKVYHVVTAGCKKHKITMLDMFSIYIHIQNLVKIHVFLNFKYAEEAKATLIRLRYEEGSKEF